MILIIYFLLNYGNRFELKFDRRLVNVNSATDGSVELVIDTIFFYIDIYVCVCVCVCVCLCLCLCVCHFA